MEIIRQPRLVGHELQRMHRYGVLAAYLPEFRAHRRADAVRASFTSTPSTSTLLFVLLMMRHFRTP